MRMRPLLLMALAGLTACGGDAGSTGFASGMGSALTASSTGPDTSSTGTSSTSSTDSSSSSTSTSSESSADSSPVLDMAMPDFGPLQPAGCQGKIDFLFVISAGGTMKNDQDKLLAGFPGFMAAIEDQLPDFDVHILSASTKPKFGLDSCADCTDSCDPNGELPYCGAQFTICDKKIGAAVTFPTGVAASNRRCVLDSGRRYITSGQHDIDKAFACIAQVGIDGAGLTGQAMVAALQSEINDPSDEYACNGGFLREDALLVVTIIQDDYDEKSLGTVDEWIEALRAAKGYDDDAFAVLVLSTDVDVGYKQLCSPNEFNPNKNRLRVLADSVEHGFIGSICSDSYVPFFAEHVGAIVDLCDDFAPPG